MGGGTPQHGSGDEWVVIPPAAPVQAPQPVQSVTFSVNGERVDATVDPHMKLVDYLRTELGLTGTKIGCGEGGCGACTVVLANYNTAADSEEYAAINSCLRPVVSIDGTAVWTVEGIGNELTGLHEIQKRLADGLGTQCGFCSPGIVMNFYELWRNSGGHLTEEQVENRFDGNICRCTGYRPILSSLKSLATDHKVPRAQKELGACAGTCGDIEDLCCSHNRAHERQQAAHPPHESKRLPTIEAFLDELAVPLVPTWLREHAAARRSFAVQGSVADGASTYYHPTSLAEVWQCVAAAGTGPIKYMVGNTSIGIYKNVPVQTYIDLKGVAELTAVSSDATGITVGAACTITQMIEQMEAAGNKFPARLLAHMYRVANFQVRNAASWAGNIALVTKNADFESDIYPLLFALDGRLSIVSATGHRTASFAGLTLAAGELIESVTLPFPTAAAGETAAFDSYKVALRHQNSHAFVNAAFLVTKDASGTVQNARLVYGCVKATPVRAAATETALMGNKFNEATLQACLTQLGKEMVPDAGPGMVEYRTALVRNFFFKFFASQTPNLNPNLASITTHFERGLSSGHQKYYPDPKTYPVAAYVPKLGGRKQTSGAAVYTDDVAMPRRGVYGAFVLTTQGNATIDSVNWDACKTMPGFVAYIDASDIPGANDAGVIVDDEELFATTTSLYAGQLLALVVADTQAHADAAALKVEVQYTSLGQPLVTIEDAVAAKSFFPGTATNPYMARVVEQGDVATAFHKCDFSRSGSISCGSQYAFYMEPQAALAEWREGRLVVHSATQDPMTVHAQLMGILTRSANEIEVRVRRLGGGFGTKGTRPILVAGAAAVAATKLNRPVRIANTRQVDMRVMGKRHAFQSNYKVGFNHDGRIMALEQTVYANGGCTYDVSLSVAMLAQLVADNCYNIPNYKSSTTVCRTNIATNTAVRSFGVIQSIFLTETIVDHVATMLGMEAAKVREINFYKPGQVTPYGQVLDQYTLPQVWALLKKNGAYEAKLADVAKFNSANRWMKRGVAITPIKYGLGYAGNTTVATINVFREDGSVQVSHNGIEMGQGLYTKVAQAVAYTLGVPLSLVALTDTSTTKTPNGSGTGGSVTSEMVSQAAMMAADKLNTILAPFKAAYPGATWAQIVAAAAGSGVPLTTTATFSGADWNSIGLRFLKKAQGGPFMYNFYGAGLTEVEVDCLTGRVQVLSTNILCDLGTSMNPAVDIGQSEGGFIQGMGFLLCEDLQFTKDGVLTTDSTWTYKPPEAHDIPLDFNISFLPNAVEKKSILGSKATGEPPMITAVSVPLAIKNAIMAALKEIGVNDYVPLDAPYTPEKILMACRPSADQLNLL